MRWLEAFGVRTEGGRLAQRLGSYPPYQAPFPGHPPALDLAQARANLDYLLAQRTERLANLDGLLADDGIDVRSGLTADDPSPLLDGLHHWAKTQWPGLHDRKLASTATWLRSSRDGPEIVYSLLMDVAILLGELIVRRRPRFVWSLDLDPENGPGGIPGAPDDFMTSYKRPVVMIPKGGPLLAPIILDVEDIVVMKYLQAKQPTSWLLNDFRRFVVDARNGAWERPFDETGS